MSWATGDFIGDGRVDVNDLTIVLANFGQTLGASAGRMAAVPEPSSLMLIGLGIAALVAGVRRSAWCVLHPAADASKVPRENAVDHFWVARP